MATNEVNGWLIGAWVLLLDGMLKCSDNQRGVVCAGGNLVKAHRKRVVDHGELCGGEHMERGERGRSHTGRGIILGNVGSNEALFGLTFGGETGTKLCVICLGNFGHHEVVEVFNGQDLACGRRCRVRRGGR
jgi:hypothetical protein